MSDIAVVRVLLLEQDLKDLKKKTSNNIAKDAIAVAVKYYLDHEVA